MSEALALQPPHTPRLKMSLEAGGKPEVAPPRKMGRPQLYPGDPCVAITVWIPRSICDRYIRVAHKHQTSVTRVLRTILLRHMPAAE